MKLISIHIEASHYDPNVATMLEFAAVGFNSEKEFEPVIYHKRFVPPDTFKASIQAMIINHQLLRDIEMYKSNELTPSETLLYNRASEELLNDFMKWVSANDLMILDATSSNPYSINVCGKNFSAYAGTILHRNHESWKSFINKRVLDVAAFYVKSGDIKLPNLKDCKDRSGITFKTHDNPSALTDAMEIAQMIHLKLSKQHEESFN